MTVPQQSLGLRPSPIETRGERWIAQTALWARAVAVVAALAGGAILLAADWSVVNLPVQVYIAIVWAAPAPIYLMLSFFLRKMHGSLCMVVCMMALFHALVSLAVPLLDPHNHDLHQWYYLLALALAAGAANLAVSAYWAGRWLRNPISAHDRRRGFEILVSHDHSIVNDRAK